MESPIGCSENIKILCFMYKCFYFFPISCRYEGACFEMWNHSPLELCEFSTKIHCCIFASACSLPVDAEGQVPCALTLHWLGCPGLMVYPKVGCCVKGSDIMKPKGGAVAAAPATTTIIIQQGAPQTEEMV
jgi:hypothetical protein